MLEIADLMCLLLYMMYAVWVSTHTVINEVAFSSRSVDYVVTTPMMDYARKYSSELSPVFVYVALCARDRAVGAVISLHSPTAVTSCQILQWLPVPMAACANPGLMQMPGEWIEQQRINSGGAGGQQCRAVTRQTNSQTLMSHQSPELVGTR